MPVRDDLPWYRHFWVWFVFCPPAAAVIGGLTTAWIAGPPPAQVVDDYGRIAMVTAQRAARDRKAEVYGVSAELSLSPAGDSGSHGLVLDLDWSDPSFVRPRQLQLQLVHPTRAELDRSVTLTGAGGRYAGQLRLPRSRYYAELSDAEGDWRLTGELAADATEAVLQPRHTGAPR